MGSPNTTQYHKTRPSGQNSADLNPEPPTLHTANQHHIPQSHTMQTPVRPGASHATQTPIPRGSNFCVPTRNNKRERTNEQTNKQTAATNERPNCATVTNEPTNPRTHKRSNERTNKRTNELQHFNRHKVRPTDDSLPLTHSLTHCRSLTATHSLLRNVINSVYERTSTYHEIPKVQFCAAVGSYILILYFGVLKY